MIKLTDNDLNDYKKSFDSYKDMNKVVYFCLMKLGNDYNIKKKDLDNSVNWSSVIYFRDKNNFKDSFMNNWSFFDKYILKEYEDKSFYDMLLLFDLTLKKLYKSEEVIYINNYGFENNKELYDKFGLSMYDNEISGEKAWGSFSEVIEKIFECGDNSWDNTINWTDMIDTFENDKLLNKILNNIGDKKDFFVMKLGKLNDFVKNKYQ